MEGRNGFLFLDLIIVKAEDVSSILVNGSKITLSMKEGNSPASISKTFKSNEEASGMLKEIYDVIQNMIETDSKVEERKDIKEEDIEKVEIMESPEPTQDVELESDDIIDEPLAPEVVNEVGEVVVEEEKEKPKKSKQVKGAKVVK